VARARDPLCPAYDNYHPFLRDKGKRMNPLFVNRRTTVVVTRTKHVLVDRARDPLRPACDNSPTINLSHFSDMADS
jgi:hypothetical protein